MGHSYGSDSAQVQKTSDVPVLLPRNRGTDITRDRNHWSGATKYKQHQFCKGRRKQMLSITVIPRRTDRSIYDIRKKINWIFTTAKICYNSIYKRKSVPWACAVSDFVGFLGIVEGRGRTRRGSVAWVGWRR